MSGGTLTGALYFKTTSQVILDEALHVKTATAYFGQMGNPYVETRSNMVNHKIINLADLADDKNAVKKQFLEQEIQKSYIKPSHKTDQFAYLKQNTLEWSDVTSGGNSFNMRKIAKLSPEKGNIHSYNHKRHRYDDIIMGFYGKAFDDGLQAKAAGSKPILFPANQNLGRSGLYHS